MKFGDYLRDLCIRHAAQAIAEEMSDASLAARGARESAAQKVSSERGLRHRFADPAPDVREQLGVRDVQHVKLEGFFKDWSPEDTEREVRKTHEIREGYWLTEIEAMGVWPMLFVCGADHVAPFASLLEKTGIKVVRACEDWTPGLS